MQLQVANLLDQLHQFGFVPNGGRVYYLNRSQPPLLAEMVRALVRRAPDGPKREELIQQALPLLDAEYRWWMEDPVQAAGAGHAVLVQGRQTQHVLNRYAQE